MNQIIDIATRVALYAAVAFILGYAIGFVGTASAHAADINCAHPAQGPQEECIEATLALPHTVEDPLGRVVYVAPRCEHLIVKDYEAGTFVLAEYLRANHADKPHRGYEIHRKYNHFTRTFEADTRVKYRVGYDSVRLAVEQTGLTAKDAVAAYVAACR